MKIHEEKRRYGLGANMSKHVPFELLVGMSPNTLSPNLIDREPLKPSSIYSKTSVRGAC